MALQAIALFSASGAALALCLLCLASGKIDIGAPVFRETITREDDPSFYWISIGIVIAISLGAAIAGVLTLLGIVPPFAPPQKG